MLPKEKIEELLSDLESDRIERTVSTTDTNKFCEAICAFSNDVANHKLPGYLLIGVKDEIGSLSGLKVTDKLLKDISAIRSDGNILPQPAMTVQKYSFAEGDLIVVEVMPAHFPPVRYRGTIWIRIGPRRAIANEVEEKMLIEKRTSNISTFDEFPFTKATIADLNVALFKLKYLQRAVNKETLENDHRDVKLQLASLRFYDLRSDCPTVAGVISFGNNVKNFFPVAYVQYVKFEGKEIYSNVLSDTQFNGDLITLAEELERFIKHNIVKKRPIPISVLQEEYVFNYPEWAIREFLMNAIMHRSYEINSPIKFYQYSDRIEIINPGGLYGNARPENFPNVSDYRNPSIAETLRVMGFVNRFTRGVSTAQQELIKNGNGNAEFDLNTIGVFGVTIREKDIENISVNYQKPEVSNKYGNTFKLTDIEKDILRIIAKEEGINGVQISKKTTKPQRTIMRNLKKLKEKGLIEYIGTLKAGGYRIISDL